MGTLSKKRKQPPRSSSTTTPMHRRPVKKRLHQKQQKSDADSNEIFSCIKDLVPSQHNTSPPNRETSISSDQPGSNKSTPSIHKASIKNDHDAVSSSYKSRCPTCLDTNELTALLDTSCDTVRMPSPPQLLRSTAQVIQYSIGRNSSYQLKNTINRDIIIHCHSSPITILPPVSPLVKGATSFFPSKFQSDRMPTIEDISSATVNVPTTDIKNLSISSRTENKLKTNFFLLPTISTIPPRDGATILKSALKKSKYKEKLPSSEPVVVQGSQKVSHLSAVASKKTNQVHVNSTILPAASSKAEDRQEELSTARNELAKTIPASLLSGKVISTKYGLAMLLVPSPNITTTEYNSAMTMHPSLVPQSKSKLTTRFKHWIQSEDELLTYAISKHSPPYSWQDIAHAYFPGSRTANQVRTRLYMRG
jgi:hypothetical protein